MGAALDRGRGAQDRRAIAAQHASTDAAPPFALGLTGGFALRRGGQEVALPLSAQRLVAFLALQPRPMQRLYVAGALWLDSGEEHAKASLRSALWRAHRAAPALLCAAGGHLALAPGVEVDAAALCALAHRALEGPGVLRDDELGALVAARDLLPDWYDEWLAIERERLRQLRLHALEATCERLAGTRRFGAAVEAGLAAVAAEPLRESAHRALIRVHLAEGNLGEARRQYAAYRDLLARHLGAAPSPQLRDLVGAPGAVTLR